MTQIDVPVSLLGLNEAASWKRSAFAVVSLASGALSAYHGTKRNNSIGWGIAWGLLGGAFPILTPAIAFGQGFAKRKSGSLSGARRPGRW
jgi:hypothetical protein